MGKATVERWGRDGSHVSVVQAGVDGVYPGLVHVVGHEARGMMTACGVRLETARLLVPDLSLVSCRKCGLHDSTLRSMVESGDVRLA